MNESAMTWNRHDEIVGTLVNPKGMAKKMTAAVAGRLVGGLAGSLAVGMATGSPYAGVPDLPDFGRVGYVAVTADEVAVLKTKSGALKMKVTDEVLVRVRRSQIVSVEWNEGTLLSHLVVDFADGTSWEFDIPKAAKRSGGAVAHALVA